MRRSLIAPGRDANAAPGVSPTPAGSGCPSAMPTSPANTIGRVATTTPSRHRLARDDVHPLFDPIVKVVGALRVAGLRLPHGRADHARAERHGQVVIRSLKLAAVPQQLRLALRDVDLREHAGMIAQRAAASSPQQARIGSLLLPPGRVGSGSHGDRAGDWVAGPVSPRTRRLDLRRFSVRRPTSRARRAEKRIAFARARVTVVVGVPRLLAATCRSRRDRQLRPLGFLLSGERSKCGRS